MGMAGVRPTKGRPGARQHGRVRVGSARGSGPRSAPVRVRADDRLLAPLRRHWGWTLLGLVVAAAAATTRFAAIGILPPSIHAKPFAHANASTAVVLRKAWRSGSGTRGLNVALSRRAYALADMVDSPEITGYVARAAGLPSSKIGVLGPLWTDQWRIQQWPTGSKRASQIVVEKDPYQITVATEANLFVPQPVIDVYTQAPTTQTAARLASAVAAGLSAYVRETQASADVPERARYAVSQLGPVSVTPARTSQLANVGVFTFFAVFVLWCGAEIALTSLVRDLRTTGAAKVGDSSDRSSESAPRLAGAR